MVRIQLDGDRGYLNVKEQSNFPLNFGVADIRDVSKRSGTFSKTIKLIGDDNNNTLLNNYYDVNIEAGTFNINTLTKCSVIENGIPIVEDCFLQLVSIDKEQHSDGHDEKVEYSVLVKDAQADFFTKLDNSELTALDFTDLNHTYSASNVVTSFTHTVTDGYVYPTTITPNSYYPLTELRPAIYAKYYWDRIHAQAGFSYTWSDISTDNFDKCVIPYNGEQPQVDHDSYIVDFNKNSFIPTLGGAITSFTETLDDENIFNPTTGVYSAPFYISGSQAINFQATFDIDIELVNATGLDADLVNLSGVAGSQWIVYNAVLSVYNAGQLQGSVPAVISAETWNETDNPLANGTTSIGNAVATVNIPISNVQPSDALTFVLTIDENPSLPPAWLEWQGTASGLPVTITSQLNVTSMRVRGVVSANSLGFGQTIEMNQFIPKKIKQKDFIKSICLRWNLFVEPDPDNPNKLIYKSRDAFYDGGAEKDWTYKLAKERTHQLLFLPELTAKKVILSDKEDDDSYNQVYIEATNEIYGQVEFTYDNEYVKGIDRKETIFSPTPLARTPFNAIVPAYVGSAPANNIRILLHNGTDSCDAYNIFDYGTTGQTNLTSYPIVSHFDNNLNPTFDLNFGVCDYYFYDDLTLTNNNMYNLFWRRTINQINTGKMFVGYFDLNEADIQTLSLSDKIRIDNSWWHINRVIDYNANKQQLTKVELMSVDTEIDFAPFQTKDPKIPTPTIDPSTDAVMKYYINNNVNYSKGSTQIEGVNNVVGEGTKAYVIGDDGEITDDGYWYNGERIHGEVDSELTKSKCYNVISVSSDYTADPTYDETIVATADSITITIPNPRDWECKELVIKSKDVKNIDVTSASASIDGNVTVTIGKNDSITVRSDGAIWLII